MTLSSLIYNNEYSDIYNVTYFNFKYSMINLKNNNFNITKLH